MIERMKELIKILLEAGEAYYDKDNPIMQDKEYDDLYDELVELEDRTRTLLAGSPTQKVQGSILPGLKKVKHTKPMLSAAKTKDSEEVKRFIGNNKFYGSYKLDGLTMVVRYSDGKFIGAYTRGNGEYGEDVTEQARLIGNLPLKISEKQDIELRGECVISWKEFRKINESLEDPYSHPRNLASGSIRTLDTSIVKERCLSYVVFEAVTGFEMDSKLECLRHAERLGFEIVGIAEGLADEIIATCNPELYHYPVDGIIFEIDSKKKSASLGGTTHHENCRMALKWKDELYETTLREVEWKTSKTGLVNPVAVFDGVDLDGALTTRATLHNISFIRDKQLGYGDKITVYRSNMVIPKIRKSLTKGNNIVIPDKCPCCGEPTEIKKNDESEFLYCTNVNCSAQLLARLSHFCGKNGMDIEGLSEKTLEKIMTVVPIKTFADIYTLSEHYDELVRIDGFGSKSIDKLMTEIKRSKNVKLKNFLAALSIPGVGTGTSNDISRYFNDDWDGFCRAIDHRFDLTEIEGIGEIVHNKIYEWVSKNYTSTLRLARLMEFQREEKMENKKLHNFNFAITGKLDRYPSRSQLKKTLESFGATVNNTVTKNTTFLINNDEKSASSKNNRAKEFGVTIISEAEVMRMMEKL